MMGVDSTDFVEVDPTGRYGRYNEILGKGASKTVYRAFDEYEGIEVAWNQVKLHDFLQSPEDLERLYCEIHLLKTLKHRNIMKFYTSWVDSSNRNINFITEMFTSGTLRQYRQKHKRVNIRAVKHWCRQILRGLLYLHGHDPPIIHRDLKCDNIFVNGNQGEVKIGDLGLAAILRKSHAAHCVGTPEFMAPEVFAEEYNELVDIYSFGMCVLEMVTFEYPYSECTHPVQIYKKVISGTKPEALYRVKDPEVKQFVKKCLATASRRLPAKELLKDPFLQIDDHESCWIDGNMNEMGYISGQPYLDPHHSNGSFIINGFSDDFHHGGHIENGWDYSEAKIETHGIDLFNSHEDEPSANVDITIKGKRKEDGSIFLRLRIADNEGRVRNIYFPFDIEADTALSVATEMVAELDIIDYDVTRIADMIDGEISSLVPEWKPGPGIEDIPGMGTTSFCQNCTSNVKFCGSVLDYLSANNPGCTKLQTAHSPHLECAAMHGRFGEITYQVDGSEQLVTGEAPILSTSLSDGPTWSSLASGESHSDKEGDRLAKDEKVIHMNGDMQTGTRALTSHLCSNSSQQQGLWHPASNLCDDYENEINQEFRLHEAKYQMELQDYRLQHFEGNRALNPSRDFSNGDCGEDKRIRHPSVLTPREALNNKQLKSFHQVKNFSFRIPDKYESCADCIASYSSTNCPGLEDQKAQHCEAFSDSSPEIMLTAKRFYSGILPQSLPRTKSLPFDAVDVSNY